jgi:hypothetical protein
MVRLALGALGVLLEILVAPETPATGVLLARLVMVVLLVTWALVAPVLETLHSLQTLAPLLSQRGKLVQPQAAPVGRVDPFGAARAEVLRHVLGEYSTLPQRGRQHFLYVMVAVVVVVQITETPEGLATRAAQVGQVRQVQRVLPAREEHLETQATPGDWVHLETQELLVRQALYLQPFQ